MLYYKKFFNKSSGIPIAEKFINTEFLTYEITSQEVKEMKKIVVGAIVFCLLSVYSVWAPNSERVIIVFHSKPDTNLVAQHGQVHQVFHLIPAVVATLPQPAIEALSRNPHVKYIQKDEYVPLVNPVQPAAKPVKQVIPWGVDRVDADLAWTTSKGTGVKVAVVDTGIYTRHKDLKDNIKGGYNCIAESSDFNDDHGHGTHCAGIIAAVDNTIGVIGVAPEAWLYGVKVLDASGSGYLSDCVQGIEWCVDNGMDVVSMSWGGYGDWPTLEDACDAAWAAGLVLVGAAGNEAYLSPDLMPAGYSSVIAVSATDSSDNLAYFSNYGYEIEVAAPGVSIYSTYLKNGYAYMSGTSMACPHVSGVAALILAVYPGYTNDQVRQTLQNTAEDLGAPGWDIYYGYGLVDAEAAVV
jgi:subtilisin